MLASFCKLFHFIWYTVYFPCLCKKIFAVISFKTTIYQTSGYLWTAKVPLRFELHRLQGQIISLFYPILLFEAGIAWQKVITQLAKKKNTKFATTKFIFKSRGFVPECASFNAIKMDIKSYFGPHEWLKEINLVIYQILLPIIQTIPISEHSFTGPCMMNWVNVSISLPHKKLNNLQAFS